MVTGMSGDERFRFDHGAVDVLTLVTEDTCDGVHPETRQVCELGDHKGYHQSADGTQWLSDD
jgi:hypothetical protein